MEEIGYVTRPIVGAPTFGLQELFQFDNVEGWHILQKLRKDDGKVDEPFANN